MLKSKPRISPLPPWTCFFTLLLFSLLSASGCGPGTQPKTSTPAPKETPFKFFGKESGFDNPAFSTLLNFQNKIWAGTREGIFIFHPDGKIDRVTKEINSALPDNQINRMVSDGDSLYLGTDRGLAIFRNNTWFSSGNQKINDLYLFNGAVYCAGVSGISIYELGGWSHPDLSQLKLPNKNIQALSGDGKGLFFLGFPNGLALSDLKTSAKIYQGRQMTISLGGMWFYINPNPADCKLPDNNINSIRFQDGKIWMGTQGGLVNFDLERWQSFAGDRIEQVIQGGKLKEVKVPGNCGLMGSKIRDFWFSQGQIFVATEKGLSQFNPQKGKWIYPLEKTPYGNSGVEAVYADEFFVFSGIRFRGLVRTPLEKY